jgi:hypothetical protein
MRKLTTQSLDELARTMRVIPESDLNNYVGAYASDCFWRCVSYVNGTGISEAAAASYADAYWTSQLGYYSAMNYLSVNGGGMTSSQITSYSSPLISSISEISNGTSVSFNNTTEKTSNGDVLMMTFNNGSGQDHAVIITNISVDSKGNVTYTYKDPQNGNSTGTISGNNYSGLYSIHMSK